MAFYRRNLPRWRLEDSRIFITWRLNGAVPSGTVTLDCVAWQYESAGRRFVQADQLLNKAQTGPRWLGEPTVASCVENILIRGWKTLEQYELHAYVIMPNHVHLLIHPRLP